MRNKLMAQTQRFFQENGKQATSLTFDQFKVWIERYPFVRTIIRESLMPRVWTLQKINAVSQANFEVQQLDTELNDKRDGTMLSSKLETSFNQTFTAGSKDKFDLSMQRNNLTVNTQNLTSFDL